MITSSATPPAIRVLSRTGGLRLGRRVPAPRPAARPVPAGRRPVEPRPRAGAGVGAGTTALERTPDGWLLRVGGTGDLRTVAVQPLRRARCGALGHSGCLLTRSG
ncbi:hypothetical protein [Actinacidiphila reveromycinica]|uniref:hypothetical protein n=1 Tax=Actinacidiphila reveromycinica TaxID=659352 RepID=UPI00192400A0|nr:hypothetical protein [Streptomyces sp. SN-593]